MPRAFFIVGPTASGKSELAAEVAQRMDAEIVGADAFQVYAGLDLLTAKPDRATLSRVPHHLIGTVPLATPMDAERFRLAASAAIEEIHSRGRRALVVGGSGMYVKALTHGLSPLPPADLALRERLEQSSAAELFVRLERLDPILASTIDRKNKRRLVRAVEICLLTGQPASTQRSRPLAAEEPSGVFLSRDRGDLYQRIDARVAAMFASGVVDEVRTTGEIGPTAGQTLGLSAIRDLIDGRLGEAECIVAIQQATRRYAKRQLTWFSRQTSFEALNLSHTGSPEAIEWIARKARLSFAPER